MLQFQGMAAPRGSDAQLGETTRKENPSRGERSAMESLEGRVFLSSESGASALYALPTALHIEAAAVAPPVAAIATRSVRPARGLRGRVPRAPRTPAAPTGLIATGKSSSSISLTWQDNSTNETAFAVDRAASAFG